MTKARPALTFAQAITRIAGEIGWPRTAEIVGRAERTVRLWSEPDQGGTPTLEQALALDTAYVAAGGSGAPLLDSYALQMGVQVTADQACYRALAADLGRLAKEHGDATEATLAVLAPGVPETKIHRAIAEQEDVVSAGSAVIRRLKSFLSSGAGPVAGKDGGAR